MNLNTCDLGKEFVFHDGRKARTIAELATIVQTLDNSDFTKFVNIEKNDFANWIQFVFLDLKLSEDLRHTLMKDKTIELLEGRLTKPIAASGDSHPINSPPVDLHPVSTPPIESTSIESRPVINSHTEILPIKDDPNTEHRLKIDKTQVIEKSDNLQKAGIVGKENDSDSKKSVDIVADKIRDEPIHRTKPEELLYNVSSSHSRIMAREMEQKSSNHSSDNTTMSEHAHLEETFVREKSKKWYHKFSNKNGIDYTEEHTSPSKNKLNEQGNPIVDTESTATGIFWIVLYGLIFGLVVLAFMYKLTLG